MGRLLICLGASAALGAAVLAAAGRPAAQPPRPIPNAAGEALTHVSRGGIDLQNPFFKSLGTNGRSCSTCHLEAEGWSLSTSNLQRRFDVTNGLEPLFRPNDGSNSPLLDVSTVAARRSAFSELVTRGVIRIGLPVPESEEYFLALIEDPFEFASARELSLFRRPLPSANLRFQPHLMWDGRESSTGLTPLQALARQASNATTGHAQAADPPPAATLEQIVAFELALSHAQSRDRAAGPLVAPAARGGPASLARLPFQPGINDPFGSSGFEPRVFQLFSTFGRGRPGRPGSAIAARQSIARGEAVFNRGQFFVSGVGGLNDLRGPRVMATCTTCHNTPGVGTNSLGLFFDHGVADAARKSPTMPLYVFQNLKTGERRGFTDPGRGLISGRWADLGRFKVPSMRGLAARAPYFHDGSAATLEEVARFYNTRFSMNLTEENITDLANFMRAL